jgi:hypothetical protein
LYDSEESSGKVGFATGAGAGFHWIRLKIQRTSLGTERNLERIAEEVDDHRLQ